MEKIISQKIPVSSGVPYLDRMLGGLFIGDNVVWYDEAGSLASVFCLHFIQESLSRAKPLVYVSFDRSPRHLIGMLGNLAENRNLTVLDCFTHGKGDGSEVFSRFYEKNGVQWPYQVIKVTLPRKPEKVMEAIYGIHQTLKGDVRFVFESLTGMQDLWGGEDQILRFYGKACPQLYDLETIAYWIAEKGAHSDRLKAHINQIAQVSVDLSLKRGKSVLTLLKADRRKTTILNRPAFFVHDENHIDFETAKAGVGPVNPGLRVKELRSKRGLSQKALAKSVGVTPSTISQIESNSVYPSIPALFKIAETLDVDMASFFQTSETGYGKKVFRNNDGSPVPFTDLPKGAIAGEMLTPLDFPGRLEIYRIEISPGKKLNTHFFMHKGEEIGYVLSGKLHCETPDNRYVLGRGDTIYLTSDLPSSWENKGSSAVRMLWVKVK